MEYLDIVDENNNFTGEIVTRKEAHEKNLYHRHVKCWVINDKGEILLQKRSLIKLKAPGIWCKTGGHVENGETIFEALKREIFEEIGININKNQIIDTKISKSLNPKENYFSYDNVILVNTKIEDYKIQEEELDEVKYFAIEQLEQYKKENNNQFSFYNWSDLDFTTQMKWLKEIRNNILNINKEKHM